MTTLCAIIYRRFRYFRNYKYGCKQFLLLCRLEVIASIVEPLVVLIFWWFVKYNKAKILKWLSRFIIGLSALFSLTVVTGLYMFSRRNGYAETSAELIFYDRSEYTYWVLKEYYHVSDINAIQGTEEKLFRLVAQFNQKMSPCFYFLIIHYVLMLALFLYDYIFDENNNIKFSLKNQRSKPIL